LMGLLHQKKISLPHHANNYYSPHSKCGQAQSQIDYINQQPNTQHPLLYKWIATRNSNNF
jgi:hypothetical protein